MTARAFITGVSGFALTANERSFLREAEPWGFILFNRNVAHAGPGHASWWRSAVRRWEPMRRC